MKFYEYEVELTHVEGDCSYLCRIVTPLELSEPCTVKSTSNATACDSGLPVCVYDQSQTDLQCPAQILPSTTLSGATPAPSSDAPTGCMLGGVSCHIIYPAVGVGALAVIVVLLVIVIIVLACIVVKKGKKRMKGERIYYTVCCSN